LPADLKSETIERSIAKPSDKTFGGIGCSEYPPPETC